MIDRHMHGGVPVGSLLALSAPPETQSDLLLAAAAGSADTRYFTTDRTAGAVEARLGQSPGVEADLHVASVSPESVAADPAASLDAPSGGFVVVDSFDAFERLGRDDQLRTLHALSEQLRERESVGILACSRLDDRTAARRRTLRFADVVWVLHFTVTTLSVETRLTVTKVRDGRPHLEPAQLKLTDRVVVTSQDIAC